MKPANIKNKNEALSKWSAELRGQTRQVAAIFLRLPLLPEKERFALGSAIKVVVFARSNYSVARGDSAALRALALLSEQLRKVRDISRDLPLEAVEALEEAGGYSTAWAYGFEDFVRQVEVAQERLEAKPEKKRAGRPESRRAFLVSLEALHAYEDMTGKQAGITTSTMETGYPRSGVFLDFLTEIFNACEITASPVSQAKQALARRNEQFPDDYDALLEIAVIQALKNINPPTATSDLPKPKSPHQKG